jgi:hypothetical protein
MEKTTIDHSNYEEEEEEGWWYLLQCQSFVVLDFCNVILSFHMKWLLLLEYIALTIWNCIKFCNIDKWIFLYFL